MPGPAPRVDRDEFRRLNADGWTAPQLAQHFGIAPRSVTRLRSKLGIQAPTDHTLTPDRLAQIEAMLDDGASQREIQRTLGVDRETIRAHFPGRGWTLADGGAFAMATTALWEQIDAANYAATSKDLREASRAK
jgi:hypothetical protein